jgi:hypothetical protein
MGKIGMQLYKAKKPLSVGGRHVRHVGKVSVSSHCRTSSDAGDDAHTSNGCARGSGFFPRDLAGTRRPPIAVPQAVVAPANFGTFSACASLQRAALPRPSRRVLRRASSSSLGHLRVAVAFGVEAVYFPSPCATGLDLLSAESLSVPLGIYMTKASKKGGSQPLAGPCDLLAFSLIGTSCRTAVVGKPWECR